MNEPEKLPMGARPANGTLRVLAVAVLLGLLQACGAPATDPATQAEESVLTSEVAEGIDGSALPGIVDSAIPMHSPEPTATTAPLPAPTAAPPICVPFGVIGDRFGIGSAEVSSELRSELRQLAAQIGDSEIRIEGHTDNQPVEMGNQRLSELRAEAVAALLAEFGIPAEQITSRGLADHSPADSNDDATGRARNRRVEIFKDC